MKKVFENVIGGKSGLWGLLILAVLLFAVLPLTLDIFRLNLVGKYLCYAFVAVGLVLLWGNSGVLSLGQGIFFGLGGYCMAMFLKLEASSVANTSIQSTPGIPDFMDWNQITELPALWVPFRHFPFAVLAVMLVPSLIAFVLGAAMFKRRVGGVYFAVITQALALILSLGIDGKQGLTGGRNGITDLRTLWGWDIRTTPHQYVLYYVSGILLIGCILLARFVLSTRVGRVLLAMKDREDRVRFSGYDVASFKVFVFCLSAGMAGLGGAMFVLQVGFISPSLLGIVPSIEMVIFAAVGGKASLLGAVYGTLLVNTSKSLFSESFPQLWLFAMGGLFIAVVMFFPNGLAGLWTSAVERFQRRQRSGARLTVPRVEVPVMLPVSCPKKIMSKKPELLLAIEDLTVSFDGFKAVDSLNLYLDRNELRVIIGPNGAGKTTVLDLICGKTRATGGSIKFKDKELLGMQEHKIVRNGIGRKFQTPSIYENLTVFENLEISYPSGQSVFGCLAFQRSASVNERIEQVAEQVFLKDLLETEGAYLSHGQKQWLEIGMLLMQDPELLMLDEPVAGMSPAEREQTAELLKRVCVNRAILIIEHDMEFVQRIAHKVTVLHLGKLLAEGSMSEIQSNARVQDVYLGH